MNAGASIGILVAYNDTNVAKAFDLQCITDTKSTKLKPVTLST